MYLYAPNATATPSRITTYRPTPMPVPLVAPDLVSLFAVEEEGVGSPSWGRGAGQSANEGLHDGPTIAPEGTGTQLAGGSYLTFQLTDE